MCRTGEAMEIWDLLQLLSQKKYLIRALYFSDSLFTWTQDSELPRGNDCPGASITSRSHDDLLSQGKFRVIWSLRNYLNSFSFYTNCYTEWILNTFTYFWCFLELFIGKYIPNNNEHAQDYSGPGETFAFCSHGEKLPQQGGLPGVVLRVTRLSKLLRGNEKRMWTVTGIRLCTEAKLTPGSVSCPGQWVVPGSCEQALTKTLDFFQFPDLSCLLWLKPFNYDIQKSF